MSFLSFPDIFWAACFLSGIHAQQQLQHHVLSAKSG
jgi:hypothetical protein